MSVDDESYFPRGGSSKKQNSLKRTPYVFQPKQKSGDKKKKLGRRERIRQKGDKVRKVSNNDNSDDELVMDNTLELDKSVEPTEPRLTKTQPLQYRDLVEGFVSLCSVQSVLKRSLRVSLPERLLCTVKWTDISQPLALTKPTGNFSRQIPDLDKFFKVGDTLACRIKSVSSTGGKFELTATTDPAQLNRNVSCDNVHVGSVFLGAVKSVEDHGYMIYSGISGLHCFLPFENCNARIKSKKEKKTFPIGKLLWCVVTKSDIGESINNVNVSIDANDFDEISPDSSGEIIPGNRFDLTVTKHLNEKIQVSVIGKDLHGFIPRSHLQSFEDDVTNYKIGSTLRGAVLYKFPVASVAAFSLKVEITSKQAQIAETGEVFKSAEICWHDHRGIGVKFQHKGVTCYGFVSRKRMEGNMESKNLKDQFPKGNHLSVVVIGYHHIDQLYTCSTQDEILTGKFLMVKHLKEMVGEPVTVVVKSKNEKGAVVEIENRTAFVPITQITDVRSLKPLEKLKINGKHQGRILRFDRDKNSILVTLRPTLVKNKPLIDFNKVVRGESYYGSISSVGVGRITVAFFNGLKADIEQENLIEDCRKYSIGALIKCHVTKEKQGNHPPKFSMVRSLDQMVLSIGDTYKMIVKKKDSAGIECLMSEGSSVQNVIIPLQYLSDHMELQRKTLESLVIGSTIDAQLFCYDNLLNPIFTLRDSVRQFFAEGGERLKTKGLAVLKIKSLIPVIVSEETEDAYYVSVPVPLYNGKILVKKDVFNATGKISIYDMVWMSVKEINFGAKLIVLEYPSMTKYYEQLKQWAVTNLISYFTEIAKFQTYKPNDRVSVVKSGEGNLCRLADGRRGVIALAHSEKPQEFPKGRSLTMTVLFEEWGNNNVVYLADGKISPPSDVIEDEPKEFSVINVSKMFFICKSQNGTVCYCPRFLSPYSKKPDVKMSVEKGHSVMIEQCHIGMNLMFGHLSLTTHEKVEEKLISSKIEKKKKTLGDIPKPNNAVKRKKNGELGPNKKQKSKKTDLGH